MNHQGEFPDLPSERAEVVRIGLAKLQRPKPTIEEIRRRRAALPNPKPWTYPGRPKPLFTETEIADLAKTRG